MIYTHIESLRPSNKIFEKNLKLQKTKIKETGFWPKLKNYI